MTKRKTSIVLEDLNPPRYDGPRLEVLNQRGQVYGPFIDNASVAQSLKAVIHGTHQFEHLPPDHKEALDLIASKMARILSGSHTHKDNWRDIAGYAMLIAETLVD